MELENIKKILCQDEEKIQKLNFINKKLTDLLLQKTREIKKLKEYQQYIKEPCSEEKRQRLINTEKFQEFLKLKNISDKMKDRLEQEQKKFNKEEYEEINKKASCNHMFYQINATKKVCIKCGYIVGREKNRFNGIKGLKMSYLFIELSHYHKNTNKEYLHLSDLLQKESLRHIVYLTSKILEKYPKISNEMLHQRLEKEVAYLNIKLINDMYKNKKSNNFETLKIYNTYKKLLIKKSEK